MVKVLVLRSGVPMKTLFSLALATFVLGFFFSADLVATDQWEKKLINEGWVKLSAEVLKKRKDETLYIKIIEKIMYIHYFGSAGKFITIKKIYRGETTEKLRLNITSDGEVCFESIKIFGRKICTWHYTRGEKYIKIDSEGGGRGMFHSEYTIRNGNPENL